MPLIASNPRYTAFAVCSHKCMSPLVSKLASGPYIYVCALLIANAVYFCCTGLGVASTGRYPASCPVKPGLSSSEPFRLFSRDHPARPPAYLSIYAEKCQLRNVPKYSLTQKSLCKSRGFKSDRRGSNPRSRPWQGRALPTTPLSHKRVMGIEPTCPAWKAGVLPLNYTRAFAAQDSLPFTTNDSILIKVRFVNNFFQFYIIVCSSYLK